jgi:hypothetical protein
MRINSQLGEVLQKEKNNRRSGRRLGAFVGTEEPILYGTLFSWMGGARQGEPQLRLSRLPNLKDLKARTRVQERPKLFFGDALLAGMLRQQVQCLPTHRCQILCRVPISHPTGVFSE